MAAETGRIVEVLDPRSGKLVPKAADLYVLALSVGANDPLLLCRAKNPDGTILQGSDAQKIHADLVRELKDIPYQCSAGVCGYCLSEDRE